MSKNLKAIKITNNVYWVGAIDWNVRNFHGYTTSRGTTYNAYLVLGEKIALIDTVKEGFEDELMSRISSIIDPEKIDYIISNHAEPDHSGTLMSVIKKVKPTKVFASKMGVKALNLHYNTEDKIEAVKDGSTLDLGGKTITFMETRMLHWPDSMFSYINEDKLLFSQDAFGMHLASVERFDDMIPWSLLESELKGYFANILTLYSPHIVRLLKKVQESGLEIDMIAPDHGPVWRSKENTSKLFDLYIRWSNRELREKVVIIYDTMWHSTEIMARLIEDGVASENIHVVTMSSASSHRSQFAEELIDASAIIVGSPTLNNNIFPAIADVMTYVKGLKFETPLGGVFGSYGWSGEGMKQAKVLLEDMNVDVVGEVKSQYVPNDTVKKECFDFGVEIAKRVKAYKK